MKLTQQACSLELAKQLKNLKIKQESAFYWRTLMEKLGDTTKVILINKRGIDYKEIIDGKEVHYSEQYYSAFTVAELGKMLPEKIKGNGLSIFKIDGDWHITYSTNEMWWHREVAKTEANARAKMLIYLLENKLINPKREVKSD